MRKPSLLRVLALLLIVGGAVRVVATSKFFAAFGMAHLWVDHVYFLYAYKVLGAFVILTGLVLWSLTGEDDASVAGLQAMKWGMIVVGAVMLATGYRTGLGAEFYLMDVIFSWLVAALLHREARRRRGLPRP